MCSDGCFLRLFVSYESFIDAEVQQRAVEYFALTQKGANMVEILAEMPKFPERQVRCRLYYLG